MKLLVVLAAAALTGCAAQIVSSSPRTVVVLAQAGMKEAQPKADSECRKYGRYARWVNTHLTTFTFDCVE